MGGLFWSRGEEKKKESARGEEAERSRFFFLSFLFFFFCLLLLPVACFTLCSSSSFSLFCYSTERRGRRASVGGRAITVLLVRVLSLILQSCFVFVRSFSFFFLSFFFFFLTCSSAERRARHLPGKPVEGLPHALPLQRGDPANLPGAVGGHRRMRIRQGSSAEASLFSLLRSLL